MTLGDDLVSAWEGDRTLRGTRGQASVFSTERKGLLRQAKCLTCGMLGPWVEELEECERWMTLHLPHCVDLGLNLGGE